MNKNLKFIFIVIFTLISCSLIGTYFLFNNYDAPNTDENISEILPPVVVVDPPKPEFPELFTLTNENLGVPVLYYHSVDPSEANEVIISPEKLKSQLQYILDSGYYPITLSQLSEYLTANKKIPTKSIVITFDDGYVDNYTNAFPILKELDINATIFMVSDFIDTPNYLSTAQIKEMSDYGIDIASHTVSHRNLLSLPYNQQVEEFKNSKTKLEDITGKEITSIAYPYGDYNDDSVKAAQDCGYKMAFTTNRGLSDKNDSLLELDRIYVSSKYSMEKFQERLKSTKK